MPCRSNSIHNTLKIKKTKNHQNSNNLFIKNFTIKQEKVQGKLTWQQKNPEDPTKKNLELLLTTFLI
jgi:hypothetical protein